MKRVISTFLLMAICVSLCACGKGNDAGSTDVKKGKGKIEVINVVDMNLAEARQRLEDAGFTNVTSNYDNEDNQEEIIVVAQSVEPGEIIAVNKKIALTAKKKFQLYLDIKSDFNFFFNTYDIDLFLDDELIGTVKNGDTFTHLCTVIEGGHVLRAEKTNDDEPTKITSISVTKPTTFRTVIIHDSSIRFSSNETIGSIEGAFLEVPDVVGSVLYDAEELLSAVGFSNVRKEPYGDIWASSNWLIISQNVEPGSVVDKNEYIQLDCVKIESYLTDLYAGKTLDEVEKLSANTMFSLKDALSLTSGMYEQLKNATKEEKKDWVVESISYSGSKEFTAKVRYTGVVVTPIPSATPDSQDQESSSTSEKDSKSKFEKFKLETVAHGTIPENPTFDVSLKRVNKSGVTSYYLFDYQHEYVIFFVAETGILHNGWFKGNFESGLSVTEPRADGDDTIGFINSEDDPSIVILKNSYGSGFDYEIVDVAETITIFESVFKPAYGEGHIHVGNIMGNDFISAIKADAKVTYNDGFGSSTSYTYNVEVDDVCIMVLSEGSQGKIQVIRVMDLYQTGNKDVFYKALGIVFSEDDFDYARNWVKSNLGKVTRIRVGDTNIVLDVTVKNYPIMYMCDDLNTYLIQ